MIFVALLLVSGSGAYAYTEGAFDEILELNEDEEIVEDVLNISISILQNTRNYI